MDLSKRIQQKEEEIKDKDKFIRSLEILEKYSGIDKVISSKELFRQITEERANKPTINYSTKIPKLDDMIGGFREGQLVVISAPTGQGKTLFCQDLTRRFSESDINCLWFSYEVGNEEFFERFGEETPQFYLPSKVKGSSIEWLKMRILEGIAKFNTKVIFIDHLHFLLNMEDLSKAKNLSLLIGMMMRELKKIAIATDTIIFLVSHMRKSMMDKAPTIEDLRDSSFVAQESDIVMMLYRRKNRINREEFEYTNESKLYVEKNRRTGKLGFIKMVVNNSRFEELQNYEPNYQERN